MYYSRKSISRRLVTAREAIEIVQEEPGIRERMRVVGFSPVEMANGQAYQQDAERLHSTQDIEYGNQVAATKTLTDIANGIRSRLIVDRRIAVTAFNTLPGLMRQLRLPGPVAKLNEGLYNQASHFYNELLNSEEALDRMVEYGTTKEVLTRRISLVADMGEAMKAQQIRIGQAQITTAQRREAMRKLDTWMSRFIKAARLAFVDEPKELKKLGIYVKSRSKEASASLCRTISVDNKLNYTATGALIDG